MRDRFGELELLAFIEDEMSPRKRAAFAARLDRDPELREQLDRMRDDRAALRALPEPELPVDFLVALEPQLARSMLVSPTPGAYRRRHRRSARRMLVRFGIAAGFAVALLAGVWGAVVVVPGIMAPRIMNPATGTSAVEMASDAPGAAARPGITPRAATPDASPGVAEDVAWPPADAMVHHRAPLPAQRETIPDPTEPTVVAAAPSMPQAPLVLVVPAADFQEGEALVQRIVVALAVPPGADPRRTRDVRGALVRNFNLEEAQRLVRRFDEERIAAGDEPDAFAGIDGANGRAENDPAARRRLLDRLRRIGDRGGDDDPRMSAHLLGPRELAPDYERQLELSAVGATHTVTLPIDRLPEFLERLRVAEGRLTSLRPLTPDAETPDARTDLQRWVENHVMIRDFAAELGAETGDTYVVLPILIEAAE